MMAVLVSYQINRLSESVTKKEDGAALFYLLGFMDGMSLLILFVADSFFTASVRDDKGGFHPAAHLSNSFVRRQSPIKSSPVRE